MPSPALVFKTADLPAEFEAIHQLNHHTFTTEIPQHQPQPDGRLVDRFHDSNLYLIAKRGDAVVGMLSVRFAPPFSLALKLPDLERHLPPDRRWCEPRLLAIAPEHRGGRILKGLLQLFLSTASAHGTDAAMISAAVNRLPFYQTLGFQPFGPLVGHDGAWFQPMFARREDFNLAMSRRGRFRAIQPSPSPPVSLLPGPVSLLPEVRSALALPPICHRSTAFSPLFNETRLRLRLLTSSPHVTLTSGPATLANDLVGAQLLLLDEPGMVLSNGEFGERLGDHARRLWLPHEHLRLPWGKPLEVPKLAALLDRHPEVRWLWTTHCETSTGHLTNLPALATLCSERGIRLAIDAVSSIGVVPLDLSSVWIASASSGKGLGAIAGLAIVFHQDHARPAPDRLACSLDLGTWADGDGIAATLPSPLISALHAALVHTNWHVRFASLRRYHSLLSERFAALNLPRAAPPDQSSPGIITLTLPPGCPALAVADQLESLGCLVYSRSHWLRSRNWLQFCLMGALTDDDLDRVLAILSDASLWRSA
ncbi:MAG: aspartate aminotransferase [Verrucomicrobia bacterium]|nr:MAG: aspartate aminotransferase [Verrucomicrobiota bacterium]